MRHWKFPPLHAGSSHFSIFLMFLFSFSPLPLLYFFILFVSFSLPVTCTPLFLFFFFYSFSDALSLSLLSTGHSLYDFYFNLIFFPDSSSSSSSFSSVFSNCNSSSSSFFFFYFPLFKTETELDRIWNSVQPNISAQSTKIRLRFQYPANRTKRVGGGFGRKPIRTEPCPPLDCMHNPNYQCQHQKN